mmetsp:Transcript_22843/g.28161  ORF Transcript_22843/g.28161 Transcript_22843/m.28161 type:complete len:83 (-) Transcript_22843:59-307(-)
MKADHEYAAANKSMTDGDMDMPTEADNGVTTCKDNNDLHYSTDAANHNDATMEDDVSTAKDTLKDYNSDTDMPMEAYNGVTT